MDPMQDHNLCCCRLARAAVEPRLCSKSNLSESSPAFSVDMFRNRNTFENFTMEPGLGWAGSGTMPDGETVLFGLYIVYEITLIIQLIGIDKSIAKALPGID